jgi:5-methylcytosine-specific restriction endonuclease McrA
LDEQLAPGQVEARIEQRVGEIGAQLAPGQVEAIAPRARVSPIACQRFGLQVSVGRDTHDKLRYAQALFSHQIPAGDLARLLDRALDALIREGEKSKFAATEQPQLKQRPTASPRHVPAHVKRAVWDRDHGQCTFVSEAGRRCVSRSLLEFDHVDEVARGGQATVDRMRLRCRAHNQYAAECTFGAGFMEDKRHEAQQAAEARRADAEQRARAAAERDRAQDVIPWLRQLGFSVSEASAAAAHCAGIPDASLEERVRMALSYFHPRSRGRLN